MKNLIVIFLVLSFFNFSSIAQYNDNYVQAKTADIYGDEIKVVKMSRKDNHVKVKYFAAKDNGNSVYDRYRSWSANKSIIAYSSGTYMDLCGGNPLLATPVGICFDAGKLVNERIKDKMDGLIIVQASGGVVASNLKEANLTVKETSTGKSFVLNLRNPFDLGTFKKWARDEEATVFQTHLLNYKGVLGVYPDGSTSERERRFLAVCKDEDGSIIHCLINLAGSHTLYDATTKVSDYLKKIEDMDNIIYLINLDTGCQDVFQAFDENGKYKTGFSGTTPINSAANLLVYYYE
jgi:hypothetical protein